MSVNFANLSICSYFVSKQGDHQNIVTEEIPQSREDRTGVCTTGNKWVCQSMYIQVKHEQYMQAHTCTTKYNIVTR